MAQDKRVQLAEKYIDTHLASALTLTEIAQTVGVTSATLTNLFKKTYGKTVAEIICEIRIQKASEWLLETSLPIKDIAAKCGFKTVPHFTRVFKETIGLPPAKYRAENGQIVTPPMLDVVFESFTKNGIEYNNPGLLENILVIGFTLNEGPVDQLDSKERFAFLDRTIYRMYVMQEEFDHSIAPFEKEYLRNLEVLRTHASKGYPVRIWCTTAHSEPLCEFAFLCDVLSDYDCPVYVIDHPNEECASFGYHNGDFAPFLERTRPLSRESLEEQATLWRRLREENTPLRVRENGTIRSAAIDYYDDRLTPWLPTEFGEVVCADSLAHLPNCYGDQDMAPAWYQFRLRMMIEEGRYVVVPVIGENEHTMIRHPAATAAITTDDLLRIAKACCPLPPLRRAKHLPMPQIWVLLSATGRIYCVKNDDIDTLLSLLNEHGDTVIANWVTLWGGPSDMLPPVDLPSMQARKALLELNAANADAMLVLRGKNCLTEKPLINTMP